MISFFLHQLSSEHTKKRSTHSANHIHAKNARRALTVLSSWRPTWLAHTRLAVTPAQHVARALVERATLKPTNRAMKRRKRSLLGPIRDKLCIIEERGFDRTGERVSVVLKWTLVKEVERNVFLLICFEWVTFWSVLCGNWKPKSLKWLHFILMFL